MRLRRWIAPLLWAAIGAAIVGGIGGNERPRDPEPAQATIRDAAHFAIGVPTSVR